DSPLEPVKIALTMVAQSYLYNNMRNGGYLSISDASVIAGHDAGLFQLAQSQPARCSRKPDLLRQGELGDPCILLNGFKNTQIDGVELRDGFHFVDPASAHISVLIGMPLRR